MQDGEHATGAAQVRRIAVLGCSGSGKSTLAAALAARLGLPYLATDAAFWTDDWRPTPSSEMRAWLASATAAERWVTDGNFDGDRDLLWARANLIVWLDLPLARALGQALRRNFGWWLANTQVWGGQRMTLAKAVGGARHVLRSHGQKRRAYPTWLAGLDARVVRISRPAPTEAWVRQVIEAL